MLRALPQAAFRGLTYIARPISCKQIHSAPSSLGIFTPKDDVTIWGKTLGKLGFTSIPRAILKQAGALTYMKMADNVDYLSFFKRCSMPDTFASWFVVLELHVWLLCARAMQDGEEGKLVRNAIIEAMWEDNELKSKKLEGALASARKRDIALLHQQFLAVLMSYDEGLLKDDHVLAGALWRRFFRIPTDLNSTPTPFSFQQFQDYDSHEQLHAQVKALEMLVIYVRTQFYMLHSLSREQLIRKRAFTFAKFDDSLFELVNKMETSPIGLTGAINTR